RVGVVQEPPVLLDREATLAAAVGHLRRAADGGARLVVFPEAYVPGYPVWIWRLRPEADFELTSAIHTGSCWPTASTWWRTGFGRCATRRRSGAWWWCAGFTSGRVSSAGRRCTTRWSRSGPTARS